MTCADVFESYFFVIVFVGVTICNRIFIKVAMCEHEREFGE